MNTVSSFAKLRDPDKRMIIRVGRMNFRRVRVAVCISTKCHSDAASGKARRFTAPLHLQFR